MKIRDILLSKANRLVAISPAASLKEASQRILNEMVGMLLVIDDNDHLVGTLSERDLVCFMARRERFAAEGAVTDAMTTGYLSVSPDDRVIEVMHLMTERRARHLPVLSSGKVVGVISIGDILKSRLVEVKQESEVLRDMARVSLVLAA